MLAELGAANVCPPDLPGGRGFPKDSQIRKGWEFDWVYDQGRRLHGKGFTLICRANSLGYNRIGISVHRKIRGAVRRNRIKRIIRESFRLHREVYPAHTDVVFAVRPDFALSSPEAICQAVALLACRLKRTDET